MKGHIINLTQATVSGIKEWRVYLNGEIVGRFPTEEWAQQLIKLINTDKMEIKVTLDVSREVLENIFITAIEGGSNYWYCIKEEAIEIIDKAVPKDGVKAFSERLFEAVYEYGAVVPIHDVENEDDEPIGELNIKTFQERINKCMSEYSDSLLKELDENGDASTSDTVFQYLALGELVYG
jgi:hypothetical protein